MSFDNTSFEPVSSSPHGGGQDHPGLDHAGLYGVALGSIRQVFNLLSISGTLPRTARVGGGPKSYGKFTRRGSVRCSFGYSCMSGFGLWSGFNIMAWRIMASAPYVPSVRRSSTISSWVACSVANFGLDACSEVDGNA
jgi:hypothetical protein